MQDNSGNVLEALPVAAVAAPSPPASSTPGNEDSVAAAGFSNAQQQQQLAATGPAAASNPSAVPSSMPPPSTQSTATTPTAAAAQLNQASAQDPICGYLLQDPAFVAAVRRQDPAQAAQAASRTLKLNLHVIMARIKPQQSAAMTSLMTGGGATPGQPYGPAGGGAAAAAAGPLAPVGGGYPPGLGGVGERRLSDPDGRFKRGGSCEPVDLTGGGPGRVRELRRGDWVVIRSANKSADPELLGQDAWVARVEHNGWVELQVPKLGRTVKLQQRYLQLVQTQQPLGLSPALGPPVGPSPAGGMMGMAGMGVGMGMAAGGLPGGAGPPAAPGGLSGLQPPPQSTAGLPPPPPPARRGPSDAGGGMMGPPPGLPYLDEQGRPYKRPTPDPTIRPALVLEALPPARVTVTPGRGSSSRVKELVRSIRRELLALEEAVPWNCVAPTWRNARPGWRRGLQRNVGGGDSPAATPPAPPVPPPPAAAALPQQPPPAPPAGPAAAATAAADAAAAAAVAALVGATAASMLELHDALVTEKGQGLFARRGAWETKLRELADGGNNHVCLQVLWAEMSEGIRAWLGIGGVPPGTPGGGVDSFHGQPLSEDDYYLNAAAAHAHHQSMQQQLQMQLQQQQLPSPFLDYAGPGAFTGGVISGRATAAAAAAGRPPVTPWVMRSELSVLMQALDAEVDTDIDDGPDATDLEESDADDADGEGSGTETAAAAARRRRRRRREQLQALAQEQQALLQQQQQKEDEQQPAPPADSEMRDATAAAAAAVAEPALETQAGQSAGTAATAATAAAGGEASAKAVHVGGGEAEGSGPEAMTTVLEGATTAATANGSVAVPDDGTGISQGERAGAPEAGEVPSTTAAGTASTAEPMDVDSGTAAAAAAAAEAEAAQVS